MGNLWGRRPFQRRPVSRRRRWLGLFGLILVAGAVSGYRYVTGGERVRGFGESFLSEATGGTVHVGSARFDLSDGLHLVDVTVATQPDAGFDAGHSSPQDRVIFSARDLYLRVQPFSLLTGDLIVPEIVALQPRIRLLKDPQTGARNWQYLLRKRKPPRRPRQRSPVIRLRDAEVELAWTRGGDGHRPIRLGLDVSASSTDAEPSLYDIQWRTRSDAPERGRFRLDLAGLQLQTAEGGLPTIPMASVRWAAPPHWERWLELLDLKGQVRTDSLSYDPATGSRAQISLEDAGLAVPADEQDRATPRGERYLIFDDVRGRLAFDRNDVDVDLSGRWRGGTCVIRGRIFATLATARSLDDIGFELELTATDVPLPSPPGQRTPAEDRFVCRWPKLRDFCRHLSPAGRVDLAFSLAKEPGPRSGVRFRGGTIVSRGAGAAFVAFPYRVEDVTGRVIFHPDGRVELDHLRGRHGTARIAVDGVLSSPAWTCGAELHIEGTDVELDDSLYACLPPGYRAVWDRFAPNGRVNAAVDLRREPSVTPQARPWRTKVRAELLGLGARYEGLPLPLEDVRGGLEISADGFKLVDTRGTYRDARWALDGFVRTSPDRPADVRLEIHAEGIPVDAETTAALPPGAIRLIEQLRLQGRADVRGSLITGPDGRLDYDLSAHLGPARLCPEAFPFELRGVDAEARITRDHVELYHLLGMHGPATVLVQGGIPLEDGDAPLWLEVAARSLSLDDDLYGVLPSMARRAWDALRPGGRLDASVSLWQSPGETRPRTEIVLNPVNASVRPPVFPVPVEALCGRIRVTPEAVRIEELRGRIEPGELSMAGTLDWSEARIAGEISATARGLVLTPSIRRALPWRARRVWDALRPEGAFDLDIHRLIFEHPFGDKTAWQFAGRLGLHDVSLATGSACQIRGTVDLAGRARGGGIVSVDGRFALEQFRFADRLAGPATGRLFKSPDERVLHLDELQGSICEGLAGGFAEVRFDTDRPVYGLSLVFRDVSLPRFLEAGRSNDGKAPTAQGSLSGKLFLRGVLGERSTRQGGGTLRIERAQIMRIPLFLAIIGSLNLAQPEENAFHEGTAEFSLEGQTLTLHAIDLRGSALSLVGAGRMDTATQQLALTLLAGSPRRLPDLGLLTELAEGAARELMEVHVFGPLHEPRIEGRPLRSLARAIQTLRDLRTPPAGPTRP